MRVTTDDTQPRWVTAAQSLTTAQQRACIDALARAARHADDEGDLLPTVMLAVAAGQPPRLAARVAVASAARSRAQREATGPAHPDATGWESGERVPSAPSAEAVYMTETGQGSDAAPMLPDVLPSLSKGARVLLSALAADGLARKGAMATLGERKPLRVSVVAAALGQPAPRKAGASALLRAAACKAWGEASVAMGARVPLCMGPLTATGHGHWGWVSESVQARAARALAYVTQPRSTGTGPRPKGWAAPLLTPSHPLGEGSAYALGQRQGIAFTAPQSVACRRPLQGPALPDGAQPIGWVTTGQAPERAAHYRPVAPTQWAPNPRSTDAVLEGLPYGLSGATGLPDREVLPALEGKRWARDDVRQAAAAAASEWRDDPRACKVPSGRYGSMAGHCHCGALPKGTPLGADGRHPLTPCPAPRVSDDGESARCGCKGKRGALARDGKIWGHAPQHKR